MSAQPRRGKFNGAKPTAMKRFGTPSGCASLLHRCSCRWKPHESKRSSSKESVLHARGGEKDRGRRKREYSLRGGADASTNCVGERTERRADSEIIGSC